MLVDTGLENALLPKDIAPVHAWSVMFEGAGCSTCCHGNAPQTYQQAT